MNFNNWQKSEHSFLKSFCTYEVFPWGIRYFWDEGKEWPKFNFIRFFSSEIDTDKILDIYKVHKGVGAPLNIKIDISRKVPGGLSGIFTFGGVPIVYTATEACDFLLENVPLTLNKMTSLDSLSSWWEINSDGRVRANPGQSPLLRKLKEDFVSHEFFVAMEGSTSVGTVAITKFDGGLNIWGLAVKKEFQNQGYMKSIFSKVAELNKYEQLYCQTNLSSKSFNFLVKKTSTEVLAIEKKYEYVP